MGQDKRLIEHLETLGIDDGYRREGSRVPTDEIERRIEAFPAVHEAAVVPHYRGRDVELTAYVVPKNIQLGEEVDRELVSCWQSLFEDYIYTLEEAPQDPLFNHTGWLSYHFEGPIPAEEMRAWADDIVHQILELKPKRVLEIGCGTGMLLFAIAPHCSHYQALDFSERALSYVQQQIEAHPGRFDNVSLAQMTADGIGEQNTEPFDVVIINSVIQYFPGLSYLQRVVDGALARLEEGGYLFLGDLRHLHLLRTFHTEVQLHRAPADTTVSRLRQQVDELMVIESELLIDPAWVAHLAEEHPDVSAVRIQLERAHRANEVSIYRYHALLQKRGNPVIAEVETWLDGSGKTAAEIGELLEQVEGELVGVRNMGNARLVGRQRVVELLAEREATLDIEALEQEVTREAGIEPEELWQLATDKGYRLHLCYHPDDVTAMDGIFYKGERIFTAMPFTRKTKAVAKPTNQPRHSWTADKLTVLLEAHMLEAAPPQLRPKKYIILEPYKS